MKRLIAHRIVSAGLMLTAGLVLSARGAGTKYLTLYDASHNHLLTTKLLLNENQQLDTYEVMAPDSFWQRVVRAKRDASSRRSVDSAFNFDQRPIAVGSYSYSGSMVNYKFVDDERATVSATYPATSSNGVYSFTNHKNMNIRSLRYSGDQIEALDPSGQVAFKAYIADVAVPNQQGLVVRGGVTPLQMVVQPSGRIDFSFSLAQSGMVQLKAFDIAGRLVQNIATGSYAGGTHTLHAQLRTNAFASGMLVLQGRVGTQSIARKVLLTAHSSAGGALGSSVSTGGESIGALGTTIGEQLVTPGMFLELLFMNKDLNNDDFPRYLRPSKMIFSPDKSLLYIVQEGAKRIDFVDPPRVNKRSSTLVASIALPNEPTGMALSSDGSTMYVTCSSEFWPSGIVYEIDVASKSIRGKIAVGHSTRSPVVSPDGKKLYTCNLFEDSVAVVDLNTRKLLRKVKLVREPYAAAITQDGKTLVVTNNLPIGTAITDSTDTVGTNVSLIDMQTFAVNNIKLMDGAHTMPDVVISKDGRYAFLTVVVGNYRIPATKISEGWIQYNNLVIIDIAAKKVLNSFPLDKSSRGVANPWGLGFNEDSTILCVTHAGSNDLSYIDVPKMMTLMNSTTDYRGSFTISTKFTVRNVVPVKSPRSVVMANDSVYIAGYFSDSLAVTYVRQIEAELVGEAFSLGGSQIRTKSHVGEAAFYDATHCQGRWQSCSSCHPFTRPDMLNWDLAKDGIGNPRNCKSMLWTHRTGHPHSTYGGTERETAAQAVRAGFVAEQINVPDEELALSVDTFLNRLKPYPSPYLVKGRLSAKAELGRKLVYVESTRKVNCVVCHTRWNYTDDEYYGVGTGVDPKAGIYGNAFNTPTLTETWRTAPFCHEGQYATLEELLKNVPDHSNADKLNPTDFAAVLEYINSL